MINTTIENINSTLQEALKSNLVVAALLPQIVDPIMNTITPLIKMMIMEYLINFRRELASGGEFLTIQEAARKFDVSDSTLYVWIRKGLINEYSFRGKKILSSKDVEFAKERFYQMGKATKKYNGIWKGHYGVNNGSSREIDLSSLPRFDTPSDESKD